MLWLALAPTAACVLRDLIFSACKSAVANALNLSSPRLHRWKPPPLTSAHLPALPARRVKGAIHLGNEAARASLHPQVPIQVLVLPPHSPFQSSWLL